jgi:putative aldouronate transport system substrate-binding protein
MKRGKSYMKKRSLALLLTTMMVTSAFATTPAIVSAEDGDTVTFTLYNADGQEDPWTDPVAEAITEATGVKLETSYPVSSDDESVALMIAENSYPDLIFAKGDAGSLIEAGALIDLTDLIDEYGPNIKKMYGEELDKLKYSADDQAIYQLSSYNVGGESYTTSGTAQLQWDVLKENDYEIPQTLDEFETMIKDYMAAHPQTDDGYDTIGLTLSAADWHWYITLANPAGFIADGAPDNGQWLIDDDYNATYKFTSEKEREYFQWLSRMYDEGILDNSFATQTHEDYIAKISTGQVLALLDSDWDYSDAETILKADGKYGKTYAGLPLTMDEDTVCSTLMYQGLTTGYGVGISVDCEDPVKAIQFLDYLCSDEGQVLTHWGIEGVNYEIDDEGHRYRTEEEIEKSNTDSDYSKTTGVGFHTYPFPSYGDGIVDETGSTYTTTSKTSVIEEYNDEQKAACEAWGVELLTDIFPQADEFETPAYSAIWAYAKPTEFTEIESLLDEVAWPALIKCITEPVEDFDANYDAMLEELESVGLEDAQSMLTDIIKEKVSLVEE